MPNSVNIVRDSELKILFQIKLVEVAVDICDFSLLVDSAVIKVLKNHGDGVEDVAKAETSNDHDKNTDADLKIVDWVNVPIANGGHGHKAVVKS